MSDCEDNFDRSILASPSYGKSAKSTNDAPPTNEASDAHGTGDHASDEFMESSEGEQPRQAQNSPRLRERYSTSTQAATSPSNQHDSQTDPSFAPAVFADLDKATVEPYNTLNQPNVPFDGSPRQITIAKAAIRQRLIDELESETVDLYDVDQCLVVSLYHQELAKACYHLVQAANAARSTVFITKMTEALESGGGRHHFKEESTERANEEADAAYAQLTTSQEAPQSRGGSRHSQQQTSEHPHQPPIIHYNTDVAPMDTLLQGFPDQTQASFEQGDEIIPFDSPDSLFRAESPDDLFPEG